MARTRAKDYDDKRQAMLHQAASVFARDGYDRASMAGVAAECGVSKALLYHYYASKEALLFDIINSHLEELIDAVDAADEPGLPAPERLERLVASLLEAYRDADAEHKLQVGAMQLLPEPDQVRLKSLERELVTRFADAVRAVDPQAFEGTPLLKPVTMSLFGMLNWFYMWFRDGGPVSRREYAALATKLLVGGIRGLT
ncbi:TetR/AcrR family transcriptional regulator [Aquibium sp. LZ166]|uniref:TetR/AcrR family transcriptional regulator n=1 Tax=Aquibium pacificus TaxID=3153579 RepID=A0ABV3SDQ6_9HYPH